MTQELSAEDRKKKAKMERSLAGLGPQWVPRGRRLLGLLPSDPRCTMCLSPFEGLGGRLVRAILDTKRSAYNSLVCNHCEEVARKLQISATTEMSLFFADIRGSTPLAEGMDPAEFTRLIDRFYTESTHVLVHGYAVVDKLAGDQVSGYFIPGITGLDFARRAVETAQELLRVTGYADPEGPWVPVGVGINTGEATFGIVGSPGGMTEFTALGDAANVGARLASNAAAGEVLLSESTVQKAEMDTTALERRTVELKGKSEPMDVWVMRVGT